MTLNEFKAWLDGFREGKEGLSKDEIALMRQKLDEVVEPAPMVMPPVVVEPWRNPVPYSPWPPYSPWTFCDDSTAVPSFWDSPGGTTVVKYSGDTQ
jgi:hypothetical protein